MSEKVNAQDERNFILDEIGIQPEDRPTDPMAFERFVREQIFFLPDGRTRAIARKVAERATAPQGGEESTKAFERILTYMLGRPAGRSSTTPAVHKRRSAIYLH